MASKSDHPSPPPSLPGARPAHEPVAAGQFGMSEALPPRVASNGPRVEDFSRLLVDGTRAASRPMFGFGPRKGG